MMRSKSFLAYLATAMLVVVGCGRGSQTEKPVAEAAKPAAEAAKPAAEAEKPAAEAAKPAAEAANPAAEVAKPVGAAAPAGAKLTAEPEAGLVPVDCFAAVVIHPQRIFQSPQAAQSAEVKKLLEGEEYQRVVKQIGFDFRDLEAVTFLVFAPPSPKEDVPEPVVLLRFARPIDRDQIIGNLAGQGFSRSEQTLAGKTYYKLSPPAERPYAQAKYFVVPDDRTIGFVERDEEMVRKMLSAGGKDSPLAEALRRADLDHDVVGVVVMQPAQPLVAGLAGQLPADAPPYIAQLKTLAGGVKGATIAVDIYTDPFAKATLQTDAPETAAKLLPALKFGQEILVSLLEAQKQQHTAAANKPRESDAALEELAAQVLAGLSISQREAGLEAVVRLKNPEAAFWLVRGPIESRKEFDKLKARAQISMYRMSLEVYRLDVGSYPTEKQGLDALVKRPADLDEKVRWNGPYATEQAKDPWGHDYQYRLPAKRGNPEQPEIWSNGPDGQSDTADDIGTWDLDTGRGGVKVNLPSTPPPPPELPKTPIPDEPPKK